MAGIAEGGEPAVSEVEGRAGPRPRARPAPGRVTARGVVAGVLVFLVAVVCVRLGFWQLDRLEQRRLRNEVLHEARARPPLPLDAAAAATVAREPEAYLYRPVRLQGEYRPGGDVLLRGRSHLGSPGVHLLSFLHLDGGTAVLVNRGWLYAPDAATVDPRPFHEADVGEIVGLLLTYPPAEGQGTPTRIELPGGDVLSLGRLDRIALQAHSADLLLPFYVQQLPDAGLSEPPFRLAAPAIDEGPHLGYAVQWFSLAAVFVLGFLVVVARRGQ